MYVTTCTLDLHSLPVYSSLVLKVEKGCHSRLEDSVIFELGGGGDEKLIFLWRDGSHFVQKGKPD